MATLALFILFGYRRSVSRSVSRGLTPAEIGAELRKAREAQGKTQSEIAVECAVTQPLVQKWEAGNALPTTRRARAVAKVYRVRPDLLLPAIEAA